MTIDSRNMKRVLSLLILIATFWGVHAQELEVKVTVNTPKLQTASPEVFETLEKAIEEFMNNQKWTSEAFENEERISLNLVLTISKELSANTFEGELSLQSIRPVYGSAYSSPMFKHLDKDVVFTYEQYQPLEFSETNYLNNLTSILGYYAYIVLGMDFDSFAAFGGEPYYQLAQDIVNRIPPNVAGSVPGWRSTEGNRNRYWLIENILSPRCRPFRQAIYDYHRHGLDFMQEDVAAGRAVMADAIDALNGVNRSYPNSMILQVFASTKADEIIEIFKAAPPQEKTKIVQTMSSVDPPRASNYRQEIGR